MPRDSRQKPSWKRRATAILGVLGVAAAATLPASAQEAPADADRVVEEAKLLYTRVLRDEPDDLQRIAQFVLGRRVTDADDILRDILADTSTEAAAPAEQVIIATIIGPERRLLPEIVDRLRMEGGSTLDRRLDPAFQRYADFRLVEQLAALARDRDRPVRFRREVLRTLGRTDRDAALDILLEFWGGPEAEFREQAAKSFRYLAPFAPRDREGALVYIERVRKENLPASVILRREARKLVAENARLRAGTARPDADPRLVADLLEMLPVATLAHLTKRYLASPSEELRAAGARRIATFPYPKERKRELQLEVGKACLAALVSEGSERVELALLETLRALAQPLRGHVTDPWMQALELRVQRHESFSRGVQFGAVRLLGALQDRRALSLLKLRFEVLEDTDWEFRKELLAAIKSVSPVETAWLIDRGGKERDDRILKDILVMLAAGKSSGRDLEVVAFYRAVLGRQGQNGHGEDVHATAALVLADKWGTPPGVPEALDALIEVGLVHERTSVRKTSATALGAPPPGAVPGRPLAALKTMLKEERDPDTRTAAAGAVVKLDPDRAVENLINELANDTNVWGTYLSMLRSKVVKDDLSPRRAVEDARYLFEKGMVPKALTLLEHIVASRPDELWPASGDMKANPETATERGIVRRRLAEYLLAAGEPGRALQFAEKLYAAEARQDDPKHEWRLLYGRALIAEGDNASLARAKGVLRELQKDTALPADTRPGVLFWLGRCLAELGDPTRALRIFAAFEAAPKPAAASPDVPARYQDEVARLPELVAAAQKKSDAERDQVRKLVADLGGAADAEARKTLATLGYRAGVHLLSQLGGDVEGELTDEALDQLRREFADDARLRRILEAVRILSSKGVLPADEGDAAWRAALREARKQLERILSQAWAR